MDELQQIQFEEMMDFEIKEAERDYEMSKNRQVGGNHYKIRGMYQPWNIIDEYNLDFYEGNVLKYLLRTKNDRLEDLEKARHYLDKAIENIRLEELVRKEYEYSRNSIKV